MKKIIKYVMTVIKYLFTLFHHFYIKGISFYY